MDAIETQNMDRETLARLRWQCRRGMLELDLMLQPFVEDHYKSLSEPGKAAFRKLLTYPDQELLEMLMGNKIPGNREVADVTHKIRQAIANQACLLTTA
ncbi:MAG: succinate dehydrogenase assembly factor 2 [Gammaproteobacteria bacterium]|jgi:antitoxin CptB